MKGDFFHSLAAQRKPTHFLIGYYSLMSKQFLGTSMILSAEF